MLRHTFGLETEALAVESAVSAAIDDGCVTVDITAGGERPYSTEEVGRTITDTLMRLVPDSDPLLTDPRV